MKARLSILLVLLVVTFSAKAYAITYNYIFSGHVTASTCDNVSAGELFSGKLQFERSLTEPYTGVGWLNMSFMNGLTLESDNLFNIDNNELWYQVWGTGFSGYLPDATYISIDDKEMMTELLTTDYGSALISGAIDSIADPVPEPATFVLLALGLLLIGIAKCPRLRARGKAAV